MANISFKTNLEKIRVQFLFDHPFLSVLALSIPIIYRDNPNEPIETNGTTILIDEKKSSIYSFEELKFIYAHILLHILLKHPFRMRDRDNKIWNRSSDIVVNLLLKDFKRVGTPPQDEVFLEKFKDKSVEEVYQVLYKENPEGEGTPNEDNPKEQKQDLIEGEGEGKEEEIDNIIVQAMGIAQKQGDIPASFLEVITEVTKPKIDLETLLHTYFSESFFEKETNFSYPNRRFIHQNIYLPGYKYEHNRLKLYIALDISMSISKETFSKFLGIIDAILRMSSDFEVTVIPFDEKVHKNSIISYSAQENLPTIAFEKGNGGTDFYPLLEYINLKTDKDSILMVLSDGLFKIEQTPPLPTIFLISQKIQMARLKPYGDVFYFDL